MTPATCVAAEDAAAVEARKRADALAPALEPWAYLRQHLAPRPVARTDALPHWTRLSATRA